MDTKKYIKDAASDGDGYLVVPAIQHDHGVVRRDESLHRWIQRERRMDNIIDTVCSYRDDRTIQTYGRAVSTVAGQLYRIHGLHRQDQIYSSSDDAGQGLLWTRLYCHPRGRRKIGGGPFSAVFGR